MTSERADLAKRLRAIEFEPLPPDYRETARNAADALERADQVRDAALEEAAKVADGIQYPDLKVASDLEKFAYDIRCNIASAIRALASKPQVVDALGDPKDWSNALYELQRWCSSAFLAGEEVEDDESCKAELYSFLCGLLGYLVAGEEAATALASQPAPAGVDWKAFAKELSDALLAVRPLGGSELFVKRGDDYFADPEYCRKLIEKLRDDLHNCRPNSVRAIAPLIETARAEGERDMRERCKEAAYFNGRILEDGAADDIPAFRKTTDVIVSAISALPIAAANEIQNSDGGVEGHAAVPLEIPAQRSGESRDPLGDGSVKVGPHREDAAGIKPGPSEATQGAEPVSSGPF
jgi:hypothetical protein